MLTLSDAVYLEAARLKMLKWLSKQRNSEQRNRLGQFATPPSLADAMVRHSLEYLGNEPIRFLDPAFGTGPFYSSLLQHVPQSRITYAWGFEKDDLYEHAASDLWRSTNLHLRQRDFTLQVPPVNTQEKPNLLICNPPYVRHHHLDNTEKARLGKLVKDITGLRISGYSGLYCYFMLIADMWMAPEGTACWLVPSEFMEVNYGQQIRSYLLNNVDLIRIHRFDTQDTQFDDALVSSAVLWFCKRQPSKSGRILVTYGGSLLHPNHATYLDRDSLLNAAKWNKQVLSGQTDSSPGQHTSGPTFSDLFLIKRGLATGNNEFFIMTRQEAASRGLPPEFLKPILPSPRFLRQDIVESDDDGEPLLPGKLVLLDCNLPIDEVQRDYPSLWRYLQWGTEQGVNSTYLCRQREPWYSQEKRAPSRILCTYMGRNLSNGRGPFRFILNYSNALATNVYLHLYPTPTLVDFLAEDRGKWEALWKTLSLIEMALMTREGRVYGGGLHKVEPRELSRVPASVLINEFPELTKWLPGL